MANSEEINDQQIMDALRSKDDKNNPVCRTNNNNGYGFTFASTIMTMSEKPYIQILAGPPDESDYIRVDFSSK